MNNGDAVKKSAKMTKLVKEAFEASIAKKQATDVYTKVADELKHEMVARGVHEYVAQGINAKCVEVSPRKIVDLKALLNYFKSQGIDEIPADLFRPVAEGEVTYTLRLRASGC